ncbi:hypothetical protein MA785_000824 [Vibrio parahaemolyticus]|nr:hypothetical protein [Vibrio parahaemolyticus]EJR2787933.1 hypothetical protein [Vibrio parahaemolyticus]
MNDRITKLLNNYQKEIDIENKKVGLNKYFNQHVITASKETKIIANRNPTMSEIIEDVREYADDVPKTSHIKANVDNVNNEALIDMIANCYLDLNYAYKNSTCSDSIKNFQALISDVSKYPKTISMLRDRKTEERYLKTQNCVIKLEGENGAELSHIFTFLKEKNVSFKSGYEERFEDTPFKHENTHKMRMVADKCIPVLDAKEENGIKLYSLAELDGDIDAQKNIQGLTNQQDIEILNKFKNAADSGLARGNCKLARIYNKLVCRSVVEGEAFTELDGFDLNDFCEGDPKVDLNERYFAYKDFNNTGEFLVIDSKMNHLKITKKDKNGKEFERRATITDSELNAIRVGNAPVKPNYKPKSKRRNSNRIT